MGSTRLPGKVMAQIAGKPMIERVIERVAKAKSVDRIVIATTCLAEDNVLCAWAARMEYPFYRGSQLDVLDRYYQTALVARPSRIVRITSDCPLIDPSLIDEAVEIQDRTGADYVSNKVRPTLPVGEDVEVFWFKGLAEAWRHATLEYERVHVTPYFYRNPARFHLEALAVQGDFTGLRWTVDTEGAGPRVRAAIVACCCQRPRCKAGMAKRTRGSEALAANRRNQFACKTKGSGGVLSDPDCRSQRASWIKPRLLMLAAQFAVSRYVSFPCDD